MFGRQYPWLFLAGVVCLVVGWAGTFIGIDELRLALQGANPPQTISCAELAARGPGDNAHVTLTDFTARWDGSLTWSNSPNGPWYAVDVPLVPTGRLRGAPPRDICAVITFTNVRNSAQLKKALSRGRLTGMIKSRGQPGNPGFLAQRNPGIRLDRCWAIWEGYRAWSPVAAGGLVGGAVLLFALGVVLIVRGSQPSAPTDQNAQTVAAVMVPLAHILALFSRWCAGQRWLTPALRAGLLAGVGAPLLGAGSVLVVQGGLFSLEGLTGRMLLGTVLFNFGFALLALAFLGSSQSGIPPAPEAEEAAAPATGVASTS
jgi:hypothetical protein